MRIQFLLCSILALSSADLYASGNDCWRLEELMLKSLTVENRQDFLKKLEAIEAFEQERRPFGCPRRSRTFASLLVRRSVVPEGYLELVPFRRR